MEFIEIEHKPLFTLTMSLEEAIKLWKMANEAVETGDESAEIFVDALYEFAKNSNCYESKY